MPTYSYVCNKCSNNFELFSSIREYNEHPLCPNCQSSLTERHYINDFATLGMSVKKADSELKTIGDLANRNRDRMSEDEKAALHKKHNDYKETESQKELPNGMSRIKKPKTKPKWRG